jgi:hypothetical protein
MVVKLGSFLYVAENLGKFSNFFLLQSPSLSHTELLGFSPLCRGGVNMFANKELRRMLERTEEVTCIEKIT